MDCLQCQVENLYFESQAAADARFESESHIYSSMLDVFMVTYLIE